MGGVVVIGSAAGIARAIRGLVVVGIRGIGRVIIVVPITIASFLIRLRLVLVHLLLLGLINRFTSCSRSEIELLLLLR